MDTSHRRKALGSVAACFLFGISGLADASQPDEIVVPYGDLNLNTHDGVATMYTRLETAATAVCTAREGPWSRRTVSLCVDYSVRQAVAQIGAPQLIVLYQTRTGHAVPHTRRSTRSAL